MPILALLGGMTKGNFLSLLRLLVNGLQAIRHEVLEYASQEHIRCESQPKSVVANQRLQRVEKRKVGRGGH